MKNKYVFFAVASALLMGSVSCSDMLEKNPQGTLSDAVLSSEDAVQKLAIAAYSPLTGQTKSENGWCSGPDNMFAFEMGPGNIHKGSSVTDQSGWYDMERFVETPNCWNATSKWYSCYEGITRCNDVLKTLKNQELPAMAQEDKDELTAEMKFLRGFYHFELVLMYDKVPYIDENVEDAMKRVKNDHDIMPEILADLQAAEKVLPETQAEPGRPTVYACKAIIAKTYLYKRDYASAKPYIDYIINSGKYSLHTNYFNNFNPEYNNGCESIFQSQMAVNVAGASYYRANRLVDLCYPAGPEDARLNGAGFCQPTFDLVNAYQVDDKGLPFLDDSYRQHEFKNDQGLLSSDEFEPDRTTPVDVRLDWVVGRRGVPYHDWGTFPGYNWVRESQLNGPYVQKKHTIFASQVDEYAYNNSAKFNAVNFNIIRYATILLWAAECELKAGNVDAARDYVNQIRKRAAGSDKVYLGAKAPFDDGKGNLAANYSVGLYTGETFTAENGMKAIQFEHRLEFALEGHLLFDLNRWDITEQFITDYLAYESKKISFLNGVKFDKNHRIFPIPQDEIDCSYVNGEPTLTQNPGY